MLITPRYRLEQQQALAALSTSMPMAWPAGCRGTEPPYRRLFKHLHIEQDQGVIVAPAERGE